MERSTWAGAGRRVSALACSAIIAVGLLSGCGLRVPSDPDGSLDRITGGEIRVGATAHDTLVIVDDGEVSGSLVDLVEGFADSREATVTWTIDSEERLVDLLEDGGLDLAIGGMTDASPWSSRVSMTRGYTGIEGSGGASVVILLPLGENALQSALEEHLDGESVR